MLIKIQKLESMKTLIQCNSGEYEITYIATDKSNNTTEKKNKN